MLHLDLFSGIGGFALAADWVWPGIEHIFCDNDKFCQQVLSKHWPNSKIYGDIRTLTTNAESGKSREQTKQEGWKNTSRGSIKVDLLTGGFPCQPFSQAGQRKGTADDRYLWPEMFRVIREFSPLWVIAENVGGLVTWNEGLVLEQVCTDLESEDYEVQPFIIPAVSVNAPHRRDRVWIVANKLNKRLEGCFQKTKRYSGQCDRKRSNKEQNSDVKNPNIQRGSRRSESTGQVLERQSSEIKDAIPSWEENWFEVAAELCRVDDGLSAELDYAGWSKARHRIERLKSLGNAIVPQVAYQIMKAIDIVDIASKNT